MGAAGGLIGGLVTGGLSLLEKNRQEKKAAAVAKQAQQQQYLANQSFIAQTNAARNQLNMQAEAIRQQGQQQRMAALAALGAQGVETPRSDILTSPLGDTSEPSLARRKLLGN